MTNSTIIEYHRNGTGGRGIYTIAFDSTIEDAPKRLMAVIPAEDVSDEDGYALPRHTHLENLLIIDPSEIWTWANRSGELLNWRGADYWSQQIMGILLDSGSINVATKSSDWKD